MSATSLEAALARAETSSRLYRAVWRWHFYSGIIVIPILLMLATTGFFMLWFTAVAPEYGDRLHVERAAAEIAFSAQTAAATTAYPGAKISGYRSPLTPDNPALFQVDAPAGTRMVAVDPYTGTVLRDVPKDGTWNDWLTSLHGTLFIGEGKGVGDFIIEIGTSLGIIMVVTGLYLFWPRGTLGWASALVPRFSGGGRVVMKSLHSTVGFYVSILLLFFLVSGLSWAGVWGARIVQPWSTFPAEKWDNVPLSDSTHASMNHTAVKEVPWALEQTPMPESGSQAGVAGVPDGQPVNLETIIGLGRTLGFGYNGGGRFQVKAPGDEKGVWTISQDSMSYDGPSPTQDRTTHIDQYSGKVLADVRYADYSVPGKVMAVSIALHEGMMGTWNMVLNFVFVIAIAFLCVSSVVMWWLRRPVGQLGAPLYPRDFRLTKGVAVIGAALGVLFPVGGLAIILFAIIDWLAPKRFKEVAARG